jgi:hypothetical protein
MASRAVLGIDIRVAGVKECQVVYEHDVSLLHVQAMTELGSKSRKRLKCLQLLRA